MGIANVLSIDFERLRDRDIPYPKNFSTDDEEEYLHETLDTLLHLFKDKKVHSTFFILGEIAQEFPDIVRLINENGHEVSLHGWTHKRLNNLTEKEFKNDLICSSQVITSITKKRPLGFRAPQFSLEKNTSWALRVLAQEGFKYDSSIFSSSISFYGKNQSPPYPYYPCFNEPDQVSDTQENIIEFPAFYFQLFSTRIPVSGGFWLRVFPPQVIERVIRKLNFQDRICTVYIHNWEIQWPSKLTTRYKYNIRNLGIPVIKKLEYLLDRLNFTSVEKILDEYY